jgi:hypothetical protein
VSLGAIVSAGGALCLAVAVLVVGLVGWVVRRRRAQHPARQRTTDPDRETRDADRRLQQQLLGKLSREIAPRELPGGRWSPRTTNPATGRAVLAFAGWRPLEADGTRRRRRRGPEALLVGAQWPFILAVDLAGLPSPAAVEIAGEVVDRVRGNTGTRVRLVTGAEAALRAEVEALLAGREVSWVGADDGLDVVA